MTQEIVDAFHQVYYDDLDRTWRNTFYKGIPVLKCPLDLWVYQDIIWETKPSVIVETGTAFGGSALWLADQMTQYGEAWVVSIDIEAKIPHYRSRPDHDAIDYVLGSSVDPEVIAAVHRYVGGSKALVILDSAHGKDHVIAELNAYSDLVPVGGYLIVEDGNVHGHPILPTHGEGPFEAVHEWLPPEFVIDRSREKYYLTFNPDGYLKRVL